MFTNSADQMLQCPTRPLPMERRWKSNAEVAPNCPRCASSNTKFCYYNNYSLSQPRYFCKGCRRYWTKGGSLRNVPFGGGCRKNRRSKSSRLPPAQRASLSHSHNANEPYGDSSSSNGDHSGSDIDLAVVFAKFLDQNPSTEPEFVVPLSADDSPNSSNLGSEQNNAMFEYQMDHPIDMVLEGLSQEDHQKADQEYTENDVNAFGLQALLGDDQVVQDVLWSDGATNLPNFMWQLQELDTFDDQSDDQFRTSTNLMGDIWSSCDLSGFEVFSRP